VQEHSKARFAARRRNETEAEARGWQVLFGGASLVAGLLVTACTHLGAASRSNLV